MRVKARGHRGRRAELAAEVHRRLDAGQERWQIVRDLGISNSYYSSLKLDPSGELDRQRKRQYMSECSECGGPCWDNAERCGECVRLGRGRKRKWTREIVIAAIQRWALEHDGQPPGAGDWRTTGDYYPAFSSVYGRDGAPFESWNEAIAAAGFEPRKSGYRRHDKDGSYSIPTRPTKPKPVKLPKPKPKPRAPTKPETPVESLDSLMKLLS